MVFASVPPIYRPRKGPFWGSGGVLTFLAGQVKFPRAKSAGGAYLPTPPFLGLFPPPPDPPQTFGILAFLGLFGGGGISPGISAEMVEATQQCILMAKLLYHFIILLYFILIIIDFI